MTLHSFDSLCYESPLQVLFKNVVIPYTTNSSCQILGVSHALGCSIHHQGIEWFCWSTLTSSLIEVLLLHVAPEFDYFQIKVFQKDHLSTTIGQLPGSDKSIHFLYLQCSCSTYSECAEGSGFIYGSSSLVILENFLVFYFP